jgi:hypothetical protein
MMWRYFGFCPESVQGPQIGLLLFLPIFLLVIIYSWEREDARRERRK